MPVVKLRWQNQKTLVEIELTRGHVPVHVGRDVSPRVDILVAILGDESEPVAYYLTLGLIESIPGTLHLSEPATKK